jgi:hypothetical protein
VRLLLEVRLVLRGLVVGSLVLRGLVLGVLPVRLRLARRLTLRRLRSRLTWLARVRRLTARLPRRAVAAAETAGLLRGPVPRLRSGGSALLRLRLRRLARLPAAARFARAGLLGRAGPVAARRLVRAGWHGHDEVLPLDSRAPAAGRR